MGRMSDWHAVDEGSIPLCGKGFSPRVNFQSRLCYWDHTCAIIFIKICSHVNPVVCIRV